MPLFDELVVYRDEDPSAAAMNMAIDEALLESSTVPALRFYHWQRPAISFGYFGKFADVAEFAPERDLVRRWTGGGIVFHGEDLTYSIIVPARNRADLPDSRRTYREVHLALCNALAASGTMATVVEQPPSSSSAACFASPVAADVMFEGQKIAGAAHRRGKLGLLHQGSIQNVAIPADFATAFAQNLSRSPTLKRFGQALPDRARQIAAEKYTRREWLERW